MQTHRWFFVFAILLAINAIAVVSSSIWHLAAAGEQEGKPNVTQSSNTASNPSSLSLEDSPESSLPPEQSRGETAGPQEEPLPKLDTAPPKLPPARPEFPQSNPTDEIGLAEIPSLASPEELERDPVFQEFQSMFGGVGKDAEVTKIQNYSEQYYTTLGSRLVTAKQLVAAAGRIVEDAARLNREGKTAEAERLIRMTVQLREIAAEILILEL